MRVFHVLLICWKFCHLWYHARKVFFCCFHSLLSWIASFKDLDQLSNCCGDGLIMWIPFPKAKSNEEERIELCWCVDAMPYFTKFSWDYNSWDSFGWHSALLCEVFRNLHLYSQAHQSHQKHLEAPWDVSYWPSSHLVGSRLSDWNYQSKSMLIQSSDQ